MCVCLTYIDTWYVVCVLSNYSIDILKNWKRDQLVASTDLKIKLLKMGSSSPGIRVNFFPSAFELPGPSFEKTLQETNSSPWKIHHWKMVFSRISMVIFMGYALGGA